VCQSQNFEALSWLTWWYFIDCVKCRMIVNDQFRHKGNIYAWSEENGKTRQDNWSLCWNLGRTLGSLKMYPVITKGV
jgi:hypothetical protein